MDYKLTKTDVAKEKKKRVLRTAYRRLLPLLLEEKKRVAWALFFIVITAGASLLVPIIVSHVVDKFIVGHNLAGLAKFSIFLLIIYIARFASNYGQIVIMGGVGRRLLFNLRNKIFEKLQELPVDFFNQNKAGDVISRINNDTDKLNRFFSQAVMQFISNVVLMSGAAGFLISLNWRLGLASLAPAVIALVITEFLNPWVRRTSLQSLRSLGSMSAGIQESLDNFKVIVAFNRLDYFRKRFNRYNQDNYQASLKAGIASNVFNPIYSLVSALAQLLVLAYGIYLISLGHFTVGLLIGFLLYVNNFYSPLRQLASVWSSLQLALAGLDRISEILNLESSLSIEKALITAPISDNSVMSFNKVYFSYESNKEILHDINFSLKEGKTYALVGPTGGGKTTTASLMARLYDPTKGMIYLNGRDIRSYSAPERASKIGFILQEPILFNGSLAENILYGNGKVYKDYKAKELLGHLKDLGLSGLLDRFPEGLETQITSDDSISLGQKQLIAFIRAVLRKPDLLILDEATANIDTVTEKLLRDIIDHLPEKTTKVIIAHRLNTIEKADAIFFINGGRLSLAGSMSEAINMLRFGNSKS